MISPSEHYFVFKMHQILLDLIMSQTEEGSGLLEEMAVLLVGGWEEWVGMGLKVRPQGKLRRLRGAEEVQEIKGSKEEKGQKGVGKNVVEFTWLCTSHDSRAQPQTSQREHK